MRELLSPHATAWADGCAKRGSHLARDALKIAATVATVRTRSGIRVDEEGLLFPIRHWAPWLGAMAVMPFLLAAAGAEDLDAGKPPARLFSTNCTGCHNSPRGLARDMSARALSDFLRQHYTTGASTASVLAPVV